MIVEIISVGTEILMGNIVNTNAQYLSEKCAGLGLSCFYQQVVGDNANRLKESVMTALERSDIILLTGGLGPTDDDLTKETVAEIFGLEMVMHEPSRKAIEDYFEKRKHIKLTNNNWKQAMVPQGAKVIPNSNGTAPGIIVEKDNKRVILMPGPPGELIPMFESRVSSFLQKISGKTIYSATVKVTEIGESHAEDMIHDLIEKQDNPTIATYAKIGEVHIRVSAMGENKREAKKLTTPMVKELKNRFGDKVFTTKEEITLEESIVELLKKKGYTFTCVESCTGGLLSGRMVSVAGVSDVYKMGFVTYANKAKRKLVGVSSKTLKSYGAVSSQCAMEMAVGAAKESKADVAVSITGIAGPDGGTTEKPVGLVYIGCFVNGNVYVKECQFSGNRQKIRESSVANALSFMRRCILDNSDSK